MNTDTSKSIVSTVKIILGATGCYLDSKLHSAETISAVVINSLYLITFSSQIMKLRTSDDLLSVFDCTFNMFGFLNCFCYYWAIKFKRSSYKRIAKRIIGEDQDSFYANAEYFDGVNNLLKKYLLSYSIPYFWAVITFTLYPLIVPLFTSAKPGDVSTMIYPAWYPWSVNTTRSHLLTVLCIQVPSISLPSITYTATLGFIICVMIHLKQHFTLLKKRIQNLHTDALMKLKLNLDYEVEDQKNPIAYDYHAIINAELLKLIQYHQYLTRHIQDVMEYCRLIVMLTLLTFFSVLIMIPFLVTTISGNYLYRLKMCSAATVIIIIFFIYCYIAEMINHLNDSISNVIYEIPWYRQSVENRQNLLTFLTQVQYRYTLKIFGMYEINRRFFAQIMRLIFSVLNVMLLTYQRK